MILPVFTSRRSRPAKPVRLMISLLLLKQLRDLSDDQVVEGWIENPYWQLLSGEHELQWSAPVASSDLTHFRKRIGKKGAEESLETICRPLPSQDQRGRSCC